MAFIPADRGIKVEFKFNKNGALVVNIIYLKWTVEVNLAVLQALTTELIDWWNDSMKALTASTMALTEVIATDVGEENGTTWQDALLTPLAGTGIADDMPSNVAAVVTFLTSQSGRSFRGRNYIAGFPVTAVTGNTFSSTFVTNWLTAYGALNTRMTALDLEHVVASFVSEGAPRISAVLTPIIEYRMDNVVDTQRRRVPKVFS